MKRLKRCDKKKMNNKGLTLIEVLAAMLILSIVSITFLESFSYAVKINADAKVNQHALTFAQSLMESTKAYGKRSMDEQFNTTLTPNLGDFKIYPLTTEARSMSGSTYTLTGVEFNGYKYDANIILTPTSNSAKLITVEDTNQFNDAFLKPVTDEEDKIYEKAIDLLAAQGYVGALETSCLSLNERALTVNIASDDTVTAKSAYSFTIDDHPVKDVNGNGIIEDSEKYSTMAIAEYDYQTVYTNANTRSQGAKLERLYIYYYPAYKSTGNGMLDCPIDNIVINNHSDHIEEIYVMKQYNTALGDALVQQGESDYEANVQYIPGSGVPEVDIYYNLDESLTDSGTPTGDINGSGFVDKGIPWKEDDTETTLLYDVTVQVKKNGDPTNEIICELKGSANTK